MEIQNGRPADESGRLPKEIAVYDLLERLDIPFARADHAAAFTMEACESISAALQTPVCKILYPLCIIQCDTPFTKKTVTFFIRCHSSKKSYQTLDFSQESVTFVYVSL